MGTIMLEGDARRPLVKRLVAVVTASAAVAVMTPGAAQASVSVTPDPTARVGGGGVFAIGHAGEHTYIGGLFTSVGGRARSNVAAINDLDGTVNLTFNAATNGRVLAVEVSEDGSTVFLGGEFTQVGGEPRTGLAAVDAVTGALLPDWQADTAGASITVASLAVAGDKLYVGGKFATIDGVGRPRLAAVNAGTGNVISEFRPRPAGGIREVVVSPFDGNVYVGGGLTALDGQPRLAAGAVDPDTGAPTAFSPTGSGGNAVTVDVGPDGHFYYGTENNTLFAYDPNRATDANDPLWSTKTSGNTQAIEVVDDEMWIGGHFSQIVTEKIARPFLASLNPVTGKATTWDSQCTGGKQGVWALLHDGDDLHAGGYFSAFGSEQRPRYARFPDAP